MCRFGLTKYNGYGTDVLITKSCIINSTYFLYLRNSVSSKLNFFALSVQNRNKMFIYSNVFTESKRCSNK